MRGNSHVRFGERGDETRRPQGRKVRLAPTLRSGSFLLAAYQKLIDYHVAYYAGHPKEARQGELFPFLIDAGQASQRLSLEKKAEILTNNIFGVDIDPQAVEITMMSLYIKALEGETTLPHKHGLLPSLKDNIRCGNSLVGTDYFEGQLMPDADELARVKPFDWEEQFPQVFKTFEVSQASKVSPKGFDCVIGNPPYGAYLDTTEKTYLSSRFTCQSYQLDSYLLFLELAVRRLLSRNGFYGMIIPNPWLTNLLQTNARRFVTENTQIREIVHFRFPVFPKVTVDTEIVILQKATPRNSQAIVTVVESLDAFRQPLSGPGIRCIYHDQQKWRELEHFPYGCTQ